MRDDHSKATLLLLLWFSQYIIISTSITGEQRVNSGVEASVMNVMNGVNLRSEDIHTGSCCEQ